MKPQKYAARRTAKENQMIATIGTGGGGVGPSGQGGGSSGGGNNNMGPGQSSSSSSSMYDRGDPRHTQVKTYTDHGGHSVRSTGGPTQYSKVGQLCSGISVCVHFIRLVMITLVAGDYVACKLPFYFCSASAEGMVLISFLMTQTHPRLLLE